MSVISGRSIATVCNDAIGLLLRTGDGWYRELMSTPVTTSVTVWYDSKCPLCLREINLMRRLDKRGAIEFVDLYSADGCPLDRDALLRRFHARERGQAIVSGAAAFAAMWRAIPVLRPLGLIARFHPVLWLLEGAYRVFLRIRPRLQRVARRSAGHDNPDTASP